MIALPEDNFHCAILGSSLSFSASYLSEGLMVADRAYFVLPGTGNEGWIVPRIGKSYLIRHDA
jgi:hypothetical protein